MSSKTGSPKTATAKDAAAGQGSKESKRVLYALYADEDWMGVTHERRQAIAYRHGSGNPPTRVTTWLPSSKGWADYWHCWITPGNDWGEKEVWLKRMGGWLKGGVELDFVTLEPLSRQGVGRQDGVDGGVIAQARAEARQDAQERSELEAGWAQARADTERVLARMGLNP